MCLTMQIRISGAVEVWVRGTVARAFLSIIHRKFHEWNMFVLCVCACSSFSQGLCGAALVQRPGSCC